MNRSRTAFTLVELLLVIGIIVILIGLVVVGMGGVRNSANRTESLNALRQLMAGYSSYSNDHRQNLMPGYVDSSLIGNTPDTQINLKARVPGENVDLDPEDIQGYVWRLAPYLGDAWQTTMTDYRSRELVSRFDREYEAGVYGPAGVSGNQLGIALRPSYGLNSLFVGGDSTHGGDTITGENSPWSGGYNFTSVRPVSAGRLAATRFSEVRNPSQLIVFGPVAKAQAGVAPQTADPYEPVNMNIFLGYVELRAPYTHQDADGTWTGQQWVIGTRGRVESTATGEYGSGSIGTGLPIVRWGTTQYPVGHLDGSTAAEDLTQLSTDMRRWSPFATGVQPPAVDGY